MHRRLWIVGSLVLAFVFVVMAGRVSASDFRKGDQCLIAADEVIDGDIYVICNTLTIEGKDLRGLHLPSHSRHPK